MMKVAVKKARIRVTGRFRQEGSVLGRTVQGSCLGFETHLEMESDEPPERVAGVLRNAENGCFTLQSLLQPVPVERTTTLNGAPFDFEAHPKAPRKG